MTEVAPIPPVIDVQNLTVRYGSMTAVDNISFQVPPGTVLGILGSNGAGKSSTLKVLSGVNAPSEGTVTISGYEITNPRDADTARSIVGYCPDVGGLIKTATIREHISLNLALHNKLHLWEQALNLVRMFNLEEFLDSPAAGFSHGMSRRLSVILATLSSTSALILDEPFDGVDPKGVETTMNIIQQAKQSGLAVVISTHLQSLLVQASDEVIIMKKSAILERGSADLFKGEEGLQRYRKLLDTEVQPGSNIESS